MCIRDRAKVIAAGLESANIDIVGGEDMFFDRIVNSLSAGKALEAFETGSGESREKLVEELSHILKNFSSEDVKNLGIGAGAAAAGSTLADALTPPSDEG